MDTLQLSSLIAKVVGLSTAGIFAGYTWSLSRATVPTILDYGSQDERIILSQWRCQYVDGAAFSRPCCLFSALAFGFLAYHAIGVSPTFGIPLRYLYIFAAITTSSGVPWALTFLRRTNGALSIRSKRICGPLDSSGAKAWGQPMCITYASHEKRAMDREAKDPKYKDSRALVARWRWHNDLRTAVLILGTVVGAVASALDQ